ncbi:hypothetical protein B0J12DRAFT_157932 [Macrophomina phaseolina]|uniref:Uncharacterized protein n=1 Tax=Macrophomina phaseolina TaxID=35725 RepID=A0ABQ8GRH5_9PEZI|nr:hypothetical protein B0J12DRAFT_157932 [Macrophomina phaseolina]
MVPPLIMPGSSVADTLSPLQIWPQTIAFSPLRRALDDVRTTRWPATVTTTFLSPRSRQPTLSTTTQLTEVAPFPTHSLSQVQVWHCQRTLQIPASQTPRTNSSPTMRRSLFWINLTSATRMTAHYPLTPWSRCGQLRMLVLHIRRPLLPTSPPSHSSFQTAPFQLIELQWHSRSRLLKYYLMVAWLSMQLCHKIPNRSTIFLISYHRIKMIVYLHTASTVTGPSRCRLLRRIGPSILAAFSSLTDARMPTPAPQTRMHI